MLPSDRREIKMAIAAREVLTPEQVEELLAISSKRVYRLIQGRVPDYEPLLRPLSR